VRLAAFHDAPFVEEEKDISNVVGETQLVGYDKHRTPLVRQALHHFENGLIFEPPPDRLTLP